MTTSISHLKKKNLTDNTVILSDRYQNEDKTVTYYRNVVHTGKVYNRKLFDEAIFLRYALNNCLVLTCLLSDWKSNEHLSRISLSDDPTQDDLVVLMIASNKWTGSKKSLLWDEEFVQNIDKTMTNNLPREGGKHHGSRGEFKGFGTTHHFSIKDQLSFGPFSRKNKNSFQTNTIYQKVIRKLEHNIKCCEEELDMTLNGVVASGRHVLNNVTSLFKCLRACDSL